MGCCTSTTREVVPDFSVLLPQNKKKFKYCDLGKLHLQQNPRLDTSTIEGQRQLLALANQGDDSVCTYGGYLEDRTELWKSYYPPIVGKPTWHLGLDVNNLTPGETVCSITDGVVVHVHRDVDDTKLNGWGGQLIIQTGKTFVLYGHLCYDAFRSCDIKVGSVVKRGQAIGAVGDSKDNGQWFPHLHLQCMLGEFITDRHGEDISSAALEAIDGYIQEQDTSVLARELVDPLSMIGYT
jgi:murein DD-endopeptidase MepM/ murein hydrolase activator NlpD